MTKMICFDMDGTIADLFGVPNWLEKLRAYDASPYREAKPLWDTEILNQILDVLISEGWDIRIISWLSKDSTKEYDKEVRTAKREWLKEQRFPANKIHLVSYGTTKANCVRKEKPDLAILIDDNEKIRKGWKLGRTFDPTEKDLLEILMNIAEDFTDEINEKGN